MNAVVFIIVAFAAVATAFAPAGSRFAKASLSMANIVETASGAGTFGKLVAAVTSAGLADTLSGGGRGSFTVFAPTDAAFDKLPAGALDALMADPAKLKEVLLYHVVSGDRNPNRNGISFTTMHSEEKEISVKVTVGEPVESYMWGGNPDPALVVNGPRGGIACDNGVIHVIDQVLLPYEGNVAPLHN